MKETLFVSKSKTIAAALSLIVTRLRGQQVFFPVVQRNQTEYADGLTRITNPGQVLGGVNVTDIFVQQDGEVAQLTLRSFQPFYVNVNHAEFVFHVRDQGVVHEYRDEAIGRILDRHTEMDIVLYCIIIKEKGSFNDE